MSRIHHQHNLRVWLGVWEFVRCMYKSKWEMPYHIHYKWNGERQGYIGQKTSKCNDDKCTVEEWRYRRSPKLHKLIAKSDK